MSVADSPTFNPTNGPPRCESPGCRSIAVVNYIPGDDLKARGVLLCNEHFTDIVEDERDRPRPEGV